MFYEVLLVVVVRLVYLWGEVCYYYSPTQKLDIGSYGSMVRNKLVVFPVEGRCQARGPTCGADTPQAGCGCTQPSLLNR